MNIAMYLSDIWTQNSGMWNKYSESFRQALKGLCQFVATINCKENQNFKIVHKRMTHWEEWSTIEYVCNMVVLIKRMTIDEMAIDRIDSYYNGYQIILSVADITGIHIKETMAFYVQTYTLLIRRKQILAINL